MQFGRFSQSARPEFPAWCDFQASSLVGGSLGEGESRPSGRGDGLDNFQEGKEVVYAVIASLVVVAVWPICRLVRSFLIFRRVSKDDDLS